MNPYLNSINGFGGGFIAFWPSGGAIIVTLAENFQGFIANIGRLGKR